MDKKQVPELLSLYLLYGRHLICNEIESLSENLSFILYIYLTTIKKDSRGKLNYLADDSEIERADDNHGNSFSLAAMDSSTTYRNDPRWDGDNATQENYDRYADYLMHGSSSGSAMYDRMRDIGNLIDKIFLADNGDGKNLPDGQIYDFANINYGASVDDLKKAINDVIGLFYNREGKVYDQAGNEYDLKFGTKEIPDKYIENGCYARAEIMVHILRENFEGFKNIKSIDFHYVDIRGSDKWQKHIVPIIAFKGERGEKHIVDPVFSDRLINYNTWGSYYMGGKTYNPNTSSSNQYYNGRMVPEKIRLKRSKEVLDSFK